MREIELQLVNIKIDSIDCFVIKRTDITYVKRFLLKDKSVISVNYYHANMYNDPNDTSNWSYQIPTYFNISIFFAWMLDEKQAITVFEYVENKLRENTDSNGSKILCESTIIKYN